jgi:predicted enzyme related to lactoylglutathione lyase
MINQICHVEIGCRDRSKTTDFYSKMFEWEMQVEPHMTAIRTGGDVGGHINSLGHDPHTYTMFYVMVDDVAASLAKAESLGGKKIVGPLPLPDGASFGWFADPEGNMIGVYAAKK